MTIIGIRVESDMAYEDFFVDINEKDDYFWSYYDVMRSKNQEFVEDYTRSNEHYPKLRNFMVSNVQHYDYDRLDDFFQLKATSFWL